MSLVGMRASNDLLRSKDLIPRFAMQISKKEKEGTSKVFE
jgi:hypothetical protein